MSAQPWIKFYPRDWRGDQALRMVSLTARGLWMDMLCVMHEANPYGHLVIGDQPVSDADLARLAGSTVEEIQALLVELLAARVARRTRGGVIYSKRMLADDKRSKDGRKAKLEAIEKAKEKRPPSRPPTSPPTTQKPEARAKVEGHQGPSTLSDAKNDFVDRKEDRAWNGPTGLWEAAVQRMGRDWTASWLEPCEWDEEGCALIAPRDFTVTQLERSIRKDLVAAKVGQVRVRGRAA